MAVRLSQPVEVVLAPPPSWKSLLEFFGFLALVGSAVASMLAARSSADQARYAADQAEANRTIPFETARFTAQINALQDYVRAYGRYDNAVRLALVDMPFDVSNPISIANTSDEGMRSNAIVARRVLESYAEYQAAANTDVAALWSLETQLDVRIAASKALESAQCFIVLGQHIAPQWPDYWAQIRKQAAKECSGINDHIKHQEFIDASADTMHNMGAELIRTQTRMASNKKGR